MLLFTLFIVHVNLYIFNLFCAFCDVGRDISSFIHFKTFLHILLKILSLFYMFRNQVNIHDLSVIMCNSLIIVVRITCRWICFIVVKESFDAYEMKYSLSTFRIMWTGFRTPQDWTFVFEKFIIFQFMIYNLVFS